MTALNSAQLDTDKECKRSYIVNSPPLRLTAFDLSFSNWFKFVREIQQTWLAAVAEGNAVHLHPRTPSTSVRNSSNQFVS